MAHLFCPKCAALVAALIMVIYVLAGKITPTMNDFFQTGGCWPILRCDIAVGMVTFVTGEKGHGWKWVNKTRPI